MRILNFGSMNIDHVYQVDHITAPGETIASSRLQFLPGGKGLNQSIALAKSGAETYHAGCSGTDAAILLELLKTSGVRLDYLRPVDQVNGHAIIQVNKDGQNSIIIYGGSNTAVTPQMVDEVLDQFSAENTMVLIQNEISQVAYIATKCQEKKIPLAFNPSPYSAELETFPFEAVTYLLINETEGKQISGLRDPEQIVDFLLKKYPQMRVVLTLGGDGAYYADAGCRICQQAFRVKAVDTTGAGDTFTGFFLGLIMKGCKIEKALRYACAAAAISVTASGAATSIPTLEEVEAFLAERE